MSKFNDRIQQLIAQFVRQIHAIATEAAMETLQESLSDKAVFAAVAGGTKGAKASKSTKAPAAGAVRAKGEKRKPEEIEALRERLRAYIKENPGQRIEEINAALGTSTSEVQRPIKHLLSAGSIRTEGQLRATRYFPKGKGVSGKKAAPKKASKKAPKKVPKKAAAKKEPAAEKAPKKALPKKAAAPKKPTAKKASKKGAESEPSTENSAAVTSSDPTANADVVQRTQIEDALTAAGGVVATAAKTLGLPETTLRTMIKRLGIKVEKAEKPKAA